MQCACLWCINYCHILLTKQNRYLSDRKKLKRFSRSKQVIFLFRHATPPVKCPMKCDKDVKANQTQKKKKIKQFKTMKNRLKINVFVHASLSKWVHVGENYEILFCTEESVSVPMTDNSRSLVDFTSLLVLLKPAHLICHVHNSTKIMTTEFL